MNNVNAALISGNLISSVGYRVETTKSNTRRITLRNRENTIDVGWVEFDVECDPPPEDYTAINTILAALRRARDALTGPALESLTELEKLLILYGAGTEADAEMAMGVIPAARDVAPGPPLTLEWCTHESEKGVCVLEKHRGSMHVLASPEARDALRAITHEHHVVLGKWTADASTPVELLEIARLKTAQEVATDTHQAVTALRTYRSRIQNEFDGHIGSRLIIERHAQMLDELIREYISSAAGAHRAKVDAPTKATAGRAAAWPRAEFGEHIRLAQAALESLARGDLNVRDREWFGRVIDRSGQIRAILSQLITDFESSSGFTQDSNLLRIAEATKLLLTAPAGRLAGVVAWAQTPTPPLTLREVRLWELLDEIDSLSDILKPELTAFVRNVLKIAKQRHDVLRSDDYSLYTPSDTSRVEAQIEILEEFRRRMTKEPRCQRIHDESITATVNVFDRLLLEVKAKRSPATEPGDRVLTRSVEADNVVSATVAVASEPATEPPVDMDDVCVVLLCPRCKEQHVDEGRFATHPHKSHSCQFCGLTWMASKKPTIGVQFLPGFKNEPVTTQPEPLRGLEERIVGFDFRSPDPIRAGCLVKVFRGPNSDVIGLVGEITARTDGSGNVVKVAHIRGLENELGPLWVDVLVTDCELIDLGKLR